MENLPLILNKTVAILREVPGIQAIVLGGSRALGTDQPGSDTDIGLYYEASHLDMSKLQLAAQQLDDEHRTDPVAPPGGWGNWVNGGAWLTVAGQSLDLILRDTDRVAKAVYECEEGVLSAHYQPGHPHAFTNVMYRGELAVCKVLGSPSEDILALKKIAETYPAKLKTSLLNFFSFEANFSAELARKYSSKEDLYYVIAHLVRSISCLNQVLFALNEQYCLNEKKAVKRIASFTLRPQHYKEKVDEIFMTAGNDTPRACGQLSRLIEEVNELSAT